MADAYVDLIRKAGFTKAIWVGLSMGGYLVLDIQRLPPGGGGGAGLVRYVGRRRLRGHPAPIACVSPISAKPSIRSTR